MTEREKNLDPDVVRGFGDEWSRFDQSKLVGSEHRELFDDYFAIFPWGELPPDAVGFDAGCGSGRWARGVAPRVGRLVCIDASAEALEVARKNLSAFPNCEFTLASVGNLPLENGSFDFGYSLGVLHHLPDTEAGLRDCASKLKPGAPMLVYIYYAFDQRPLWFRMLWRLSEPARFVVSRVPHSIRYMISQILAVIVYWPLARSARLFEKLGVNVDAWPLSFYRHRSFYTMRTDALDRFGTRLERRFTRKQIERMMTDAGLDRIRFSSSPPYWCAVGRKSS